MTHRFQSDDHRNEGNRTGQAAVNGDALDSARQGAYGEQSSRPLSAKEQADRINLLGIEAPGAIETIFQNNQGVWDADHNGWISKQELDEVRFDAGTATKADVAVWHILRKKYDDIQSLNNDEYGPENDGITVQDVAKLQNLKNSGGKTRDERRLIFDVKMAAFDAGRALEPVDPAGAAADARAGRTQPEAEPTSYSSITRRGTDHFVYYEKENPDYPGVSYPSRGMRMITEPIMMGWPKEIHQFLTTQKGGRFNLPEADLEGLDVDALRKNSKDGNAFHQIEPGTVMDVIHNDDSMDRYYSPNENWTVEQRAEARNYGQQGDFQRIFTEHLSKWDADNNGALSREEVVNHLDDKFQSRESAIFIGTMLGNGPRMQHFANDKPARQGQIDFEVSLDDARRLNYSFDDAIQNLKDGSGPKENKEWIEVRRGLSYFNHQIARFEIASGGPTKETTYRELLTGAIEKHSLRK